MRKRATTAATHASTSNKRPASPPPLCSDKGVDFAAHSNSEDGGAVFLNLLGNLAFPLLLVGGLFLLSRRQVRPAGRASGVVLSGWRRCSGGWWGCVGRLQASCPAAPLQHEQARAQAAKHATPLRAGRRHARRPRQPDGLWQEQGPLPDGAKHRCAPLAGLHAARSRSPVACSSQPNLCCMWFTACVRGTAVRRPGCGLALALPAASGCCRPRARVAHTARLPGAPSLAGVTFSDVAGVDEAKQDFQEVGSGAELVWWQVLGLAGSLVVRRAAVQLSAPQCAAWGAPTAALVNLTIFRLCPADCGVPEEARALHRRGRPHPQGRAAGGPPR